MSKRNDRSDGAGGLLLIIGLACAVLILPFVLYGFFQRGALLRRLQISKNARQVFDAGNIASAVWTHYLWFAFAVSFTVLGYFVAANNLGVVAGVIYAGFGLMVSLGTALAAGMATGVASIGVWVDPATDRVIYPNDGVSRSFEDLISFRWALGGLVMAEVPLSEVASMTREAGKTVLVQGDFGSCRIAFSSKLKRDDCFNAIKAASRQVGINPQVRWW